MQAAFPLIGLAAFAGMVVTVGEKFIGFIKSIQEGPTKIANAFRELNQPLRQTNDQLDVANARLQNDIAKLEGKRQNTLALALAEAREAADKLGDSLEKDLASLDKLMKEQSVGFWRKVMGEAGTDDIQQHIQNLAKDIQRLNTLGETNVANARTPQAVTKARNDWEKAVQDRYDWEQNWEKDQHKAAVDAAKGHSVTVQTELRDPSRSGYKKTRLLDRRRLRATVRTWPINKPSLAKNR